MAIPESQLEMWSHSGAITTSKYTHESIRCAVGADPNLKYRNFEIYLQGSYKNATNIRGESDVDVVIQLDDVFISDVSRLSLPQQMDFKRVYPDTTYVWEDFRTEVLTALRNYYGAAQISEGSKSLKLKEAPGRLAADIIPCLQYRKYEYFYGREYGKESYIEGVCFYTSDGRCSIINYPKQHYENGVKKNADECTRGLFKPTVRMFKNARSYLLDQERISEDLAPSYFIQCLLYNVPDRLFDINFQKTYYNVLEWLDKASLHVFTCQNELIPLFGPEHEQWSIETAEKFKHALIELWNEW